MLVVVVNNKWTREFPMNLVSCVGKLMQKNLDLQVEIQVCDLKQLFRQLFLDPDVNQGQFQYKIQIVT